jgi:[NiFe] hydrogenase diaphorase moiety large subunit
MVFDRSRDMFEVARICPFFFAHESCGFAPPAGWGRLWWSSAWTTGTRPAGPTMAEVLFELDKLIDALQRIAVWGLRSNLCATPSTWKFRPA